MAANIEDLVPEFRQRAQQLLQNCTERGVAMRAYFTLRSPFDQAKLWRQSRSREEIDRQIAEFRANGADFLAHCLESVGPQFGDPVTNAPPGYSWHQWGEAVDCFWLVDGHAEWSTLKKIDGINGYRIYAEEAQSLGLEAGGFWRSIKDWPHVQLRALSHPAKVFTLQQINDEMLARFGTTTEPLDVAPTG